MEGKKSLKSRREKEERREKEKSAKRGDLTHCLQRPPRQKVRYEESESNQSIDPFIFISPRPGTATKYEDVHTLNYCLRATVGSESVTHARTPFSFPA